MAFDNVMMNLGLILVILFALIPEFGFIILGMMVFSWIFTDGISMSGPFLKKYRFLRKI